MKDALTQTFGDKLLGIHEAYGETTLEVRPEDLPAVAQQLRDGEEFKFVFLSDLTGIDCGDGQFEVVYHLLSMAYQKRLRIKVRLSGMRELPSVVSVWPTANWHERESFDLLGITFTGHPDLKRLLTPDGFSGHPLQKNYPLRGENEPCQ
jgi:NADH-quinone oxidoreductase subunit C